MASIATDQIEPVGTDLTTAGMAHGREKQQPLIMPIIAQSIIKAGLAGVSSISWGPPGS